MSSYVIELGCPGAVLTFVKYAIRAPSIVHASHIAKAIADAGHRCLWQNTPAWGLIIDKAKQGICDGDLPLEIRSIRVEPE